MTGNEMLIDVLPDEPIKDLPGSVEISALAAGGVADLAYLTAREISKHIARAVGINDLCERVLARYTGVGRFLRPEAQRLRLMAQSDATCRAIRVQVFDLLQAVVSVWVQHE